MAATVEVTCGCGARFTARTADRARGWARSCSKSCAAKRREGRTGTHAARLKRAERRHHRREFGGEPQYDRRGGYVGFVFTGGDFGVDVDPA